MLSKPVTMKKLSLVMLDTDAHRAAMTLARMNVLHPLGDHLNSLQMAEFPATSFYDIHHSLKSRFNKITEYLSEPFKAPADFTLLITLDQLQQMDEEIKDLWVIVSKFEEQLRQQHEKVTGARQLSNSLQKFISLDLDLSRLKKTSRFLKIIVGTVPSTNFIQLKRALSLEEFMIHPFYSGNGLQHVVILGSSQQQLDVQDLLKSADFRELEIPEEFSGNPADLKQNLDKQLFETQLTIVELQEKLSVLLNDIKPILQKAHEFLVLSEPYADLSTVLKGQGGLVSLLGWVPASSERQINEQLKKDLQYPFYSKLTSPEVNELDAVPSLIQHSWILKPFQQLVSNFGIPNYAEVDPTVIFTMSYILMFGMMFGDIGHGAVIALGSLLLGQKYRAFSIVGFLLGLSSISFGFVYGSLFGYEHLIQPLWMSPMHDPSRVLLIALFWGALFLVISNLLAIRNLLAVGMQQQAFYSSRGMAGLCFYLAALFAGYHLMANNQFGLLESVLLVIPLSIVMTFQWQQTTAGIFEKILVVFIEALEFVISSISGTLSFLRVAAFSLNHIALAAAVFTIANMMDMTGHWVTIVLGNIFIIVLEGAIVTIQCLRLEYYEGFSRFFSGKGKAFKPLKFDI